MCTGQEGHPRVRAQRERRAGAREVVGAAEGRGPGPPCTSSGGDHRPRAGPSLNGCAWALCSPSLWPVWPEEATVPDVTPSLFSAEKPFCLQGEAKVVSAPLPSPCSSPCSSPLPCSPSCWAGLPSGGAVDSGGPCVLCPCWPCGRREGQPARARPQGQAAVQGHIREWGTPMLPPHPPPRVQGAGRGWPGVEREAGGLGPASCPHFHQSCSPLIFLRSRVCGGFCWSRTWAVGSWSGRHAVASHLKRRGLIFLTLWRVEGLPAAGPVAASLRETAAPSSAPCGNTCPLAWGLTREVVVPPLYVSAGFAVGGGGSARQPPGLLPGRQTVSLEPWRPSSSLWLEQRRRPGRFPSLEGGGVGAGRAVTPTGQVGHSVYPA